MMDRKRTTPQIQALSSKQILEALSSIVVARNNLSTGLGLQYNGARDLYQTLGYVKNLVYADFNRQYTRQDIAKAVIDRPVNATWQGQLELIESEEANKTPFEKAWFDLNNKFKLRSLLSRVDKLTGIGRYGVLLLGLDDVSEPRGFMRPVRPGARRLVFLKPFGEEHARVNTFENNPNNPRYGLPLVYDIEVADIASQTSTLVQVHFSRVIHVTDGNLESEVYGTPRLEPIFNRLMDIEKLTGGDAEMFWKGARPGYQGEIEKDYSMTPAAEADLKDQIDEYEHNLRRILLSAGVKFTPLTQQISDPSPHMDVQLTCVAAETGIPKRILSGSERGELSSGQDAMEWKTYVQSRREDHAEPHIIRPFVDRLIEYKVLPKPEIEYTVDWLDLFSISEKDRVEIGKSRANAIREYTTNPIAQAVIPPDAFFEYCLGMSTQQIDLVHKMIAAGLSADQTDLMKAMEKITTPAPVPGLGPKPIPGVGPKPAPGALPARKRTTPTKK